jgi:site-specific DNA-adenine methylase
LGTANIQSYQHGLTVEDHQGLLYLLKQFKKAKWMLSGYSGKLYNSELKGFRRKDFVMRSSVGKKKTSWNDTLWMNFDPNRTVSDAEIEAWASRNAA